MAAPEIIKTQMYDDGTGHFTVECPICFGSCYVHDDGTVSCNEHTEHIFKL